MGDGKGTLRLPHPCRRPQRKRDPGGVPEFLDDWIAYRIDQDGNENLKAMIFGGLMWLDRESNAKFGQDFIKVSVDQQKQLLDRIAYPKKAAKEDSAWV